MRFRTVGTLLHLMDETDEKDEMDEPELTTERRTLKSRPIVVLLVLIGSCSAFGYTIYRLLKGMHL
jgi:hypothetical protein